MFTNWLTNSVPNTTTTNIADAANANPNLTENSTNINAAAAASLTNSTSSLMSTPPDVILEVGPAPGSVRFVAHSIVLGMHSGYLRSAIRLDEQVIAAAGAPHSSADLVLYLSNVNAEQFAPLLTYMYTGYLDLNVENIFGVLLATHLLHMPRALEICRSFLARAQSEGYLSSNAAATALPAAASTAQNNGKIIRPIPSKATLPNFGFIAPPMTHHLTAAAALPPPPPTISFKSLTHSNSTYQATAPPPSPMPLNDEENLNVTSKHSTVDVDVDDDDDDDEEVFIDSHDESTPASPEIDCNISVTSSSKDVECEKEDIVVVVTEESNVSPARSNETTITNAAPPINQQTQKSKTSNVGKREKQHHIRHHNHRKQRRNAKAAVTLTSTGGLQVAKAPILASELVDQERTVTVAPAAAAATVAENSKVIIDVASCDGPVRFRRILNTAYGHKPPPESSCMLPLERTQQSVSLSFHQQMAKTISQQRQLQHAEESENSESSGSGCGGAGGSGTVNGSKSSGGGSKANNSNEIYVCVYCKHSFKSQYCYQKHAKRHLNPLSLSCANALESTTCGTGLGVDGSRSHCKDVVRESAILRQSQVGATATTSASAYQQTALPSHVVHKQQHAAAAAELLRREVRPLDMNVQYYPCKTCGSKFPSYYFVHKHRKLCHADEETQEAENRRSSTGGGSGTTHKKTG